jgi:hypothetical protein
VKLIEENYKSSRTHSVNYECCAAAYWFCTKRSAAIYVSKRKKYLISKKSVRLNDYKYLSAKRIPPVPPYGCPFPYSTASEERREVLPTVPLL